ncbi:MAG TPA: ATP-dependent zinc metalloprotease FtsH, partial [Patescibacteria group bacterium]|nr:ATP-dependent zinc metalloprotease FtsH [Patescibacteria group bacterium]
SLICFIILVMSGKLNNLGSGIMKVGRNKAKVYATDDARKVTFKDVAGVDEAIEEVSEVVQFLKTPDKYTHLGGKMPKGILLIGPPGTGKTLLGRAVAGEAGVPFFSISGSDFVEMYVGVGAARVRDLFTEAKAKAPCIIFIDEIDAIGKRRSNNSQTGGQDERENTLNQLLVEMDGFDSGLGVVVMAATNRPDVLDPALLRPGRFDRQVLADKPDLAGRTDIFSVHTRNVKLGMAVDSARLAAMTPGFAGAEIANVVNEAALLAARKNKSEVAMKDFEEAIERVIAGLEKKNKIINKQERKTIAYHESGHAIAGYFTPGADVVQKVSIIPRGFGALGYVLSMPLEDRYLMNRKELIGKIVGLLAGRAAEEIVFGEVSTGASNDLERATQLARNMVTVYGMSERLFNLSLVQNGSPTDYLGNGQSVGRRSEQLEQMIDEEIMKIMTNCYAEAKRILKEKEELLHAMAQELLKKEVLGVKDIANLLGEPPHRENAIQEEMPFKNALLDEKAIHTNSVKI